MARTAARRSGDAARAARQAGGGVSVAALIVSVVFTVLLVTAPDQLDTAYTWVRDLPVLLEVVAWILLLPWMLAYLAWHAAWALWVRIAVVTFLVGGVALSFWRPAQP